MSLRRSTEGAAATTWVFGVAATGYARFEIMGQYDETRPVIQGFTFQRPYLLGADFFFVEGTSVGEIPAAGNESSVLRRLRM